MINNHHMALSANEILLELENIDDGPSSVNSMNNGSKLADESRQNQGQTMVNYEDPRSSTKMVKGGPVLLACIIFGIVILIVITLLLVSRHDDLVSRHRVLEERLFFSEKISHNLTRTLNNSMNTWRREMNKEKIEERLSLSEKISHNSHNLSRTLNNSMDTWRREMDNEKIEERLELMNMSQSLTQLINTETEHVRRDLQHFTQTFSKWIKDVGTGLSQAFSSSNSSSSNQTIFQNLFGQLAMELGNETFVKPKNCLEIQQTFAPTNTTQKMMNLIYPFGPEGEAVSVSCDFLTDGGGWTIIQRRDSSYGTKEEFYRNWTDYEQGFGSVDSNYWLGLKTIRALTSGTTVQNLRIDLGDWEANTAFALYDHFAVSDASNSYRLSLTGFVSRSTAGDSMRRQNGHKFSALGRDHTGHCVSTFHGAWWYEGCHDSNLNGYNWGASTCPYADGINWLTWKGFSYSLKRTEMKIRDAS